MKLDLLQCQVSPKTGQLKRNSRTQFFLNLGRHIKGYNSEYFQYGYQMKGEIKLNTNKRCTFKNVKILTSMDKFFI